MQLLSRNETLRQKHTVTLPKSFIENTPRLAEDASV